MAALPDPNASAPRLPPPWLVAPILRVRDALRSARRRAGPPVLHVMETTFGLIEATSLAVAAELGIADVLDRPATAPEIAARTGADADAVARLLRFLATRGFFRQDRAGRWRNTAASELLRVDHPDSMRSWVRFQGAPWHLAIWAHAPHSFRTGASASDAATGLPFFDWLTAHPDAQATFDDAMAETSRLVGPLLAHAYDFARVSKVCDVGGGNGSLLGYVLAAHAHLRGVVLDLPAVVSHAAETLERFGVRDRCETVGGSFFDEVPPGCDLYMLKAILHDWDDESCVRILANIRKAMSPGARVLVVDQVVPANGVDHPALAVDLLMLVLTGAGRERTAEEFAALFGRAGFRRERTLPIVTVGVQELVAAG